MTLPPWLGSWGKPPDEVAKVACAIAVVLVVGAILGRGKDVLGFREPDVTRRPFLAIASFVAAMLSLGYVAVYLRGGPRIIDATTYFLQGRALAHGDLTWPLPGPSESFRGRFLLPHGDEIGGIFPPGYPMLLAIGFALGAPMIAGPLLAAALVPTTYALGKEIARGAGVAVVEPVGRAAALLSIVSAALRYHTADTMSHGLTALGIAAALLFALRARRESNPKAALAAGLCLSVVVTTRPVSALAIGLVVLFLARGHVRRVAFGVAPGALLLLLAERAVTGRWLVSAQSAYYATSDGPPGCFRWGFGRGTGCLFEHGEFVRARLPNGYGILEAAGTTLRRLKMHLMDVANLEPLALLVLVPARRAPVPLALVGLHVLAYAPFYFDGNYPGGGARFFADVLPVEHALAAVAVARIAGSRFAPAWLGVLGLATAGFGVHAAFDHLKLRDREGGRPMFDPDVLAKANVSSGLVFVETDHGFALGHEPHVSPFDGILVARRRRDDVDRLLYEAVGRPPTYVYDYDLATGAANVTLFVPTELGSAIVFESESEWPALSQEGGFAAPGFSDCASNGRALVLTPSGESARATLGLPVPEPGAWSVSVRVAYGVRVPHADAPQGTGTVTIGPRTWEIPVSATGCAELAEQAVDLVPGEARVVLSARGGAVALDRVTLKKRP